MAVTRANVEATKAFIRARLGDPYVYGGMFTTDPGDGTDCSGVWNDVLGMVVGRFQWGREAEGATTESYRYIKPGGVGPFGTVAVSRPEDIPGNAVAKLAFHHGPGGGANSHMWGELDGMLIESGGSKGLVTAPSALAINAPYATHWAYLPGPIVEDGTAVTVAEPRDTLFADVSEWQVPVNDSYPYRVLSIRSNDGTHRDKNWAANYAWCKRAADEGRIAFFLVYFVWRPGIDNLAVVRDMIGTPHPKMAIEIDIESWGGQITGNQSPALNATRDALATWLGDPRRVVAYGNGGDLKNLWPNRPADMLIRLAAYGSNPDFPGKVAHQYTDGQGHGGGLPEGCPPFGNCDMNSADGCTPTQFAAVLGITSSTPPTPGGEVDMATITVPKAEWDRVVRELTQQHRSRSPLRHLGEQEIDTWAGIDLNDDANDHVVATVVLGCIGDQNALALLAEVASASGDENWPDRQRDSLLARRILAFIAAVNPNALTSANPAALQKIIDKGVPA